MVEETLIENSKMKLSIVLLAFIAVHVQATVLTRGNIESLSIEHVEYINRLNTTWKAAQNFKGYKIDELRGLCGTILESKDKKADILGKLNVDKVKPLPKEFDSRKQWPECAEVISHIRDQGGCANSWAVAPVAAMTGRACIGSGGRNTTQLSAQALTSCCDYCGSCKGGSTYLVWYYLTAVGIVTGGDYGDNKTCAPYLFEPCEHHGRGVFDSFGLQRRPKCEYKLPTPKCSNKCANKQIDYESDKSYGKNEFRTYSMFDTKAKLFEGGPLSATMEVFDDFVLYKEGVYQITRGAKYIGGHTVELIGWGTTDDGTEYWIAKNSWNTDWGDKGFFKIKFGQVKIDEEIRGALARE